VHTGQVVHRTIVHTARQALECVRRAAETPTLADAEQSEVVRICCRVCRNHGAPLIVGAGSNNTARSVVALADLAKFPEVRAALTTVPYYSRPGEAGVLEHFRTLAGRSPVPVVVYNIPYRTGQAVSWRVMRQLAAMPGITGVKHSAGSIDADTIAMMAERPTGFTVLGGDCLYLSPLLALGEDGAISAAAHVCTEAFARLISLWRDGQAAEGRQLGHRLAPLSRALFAEPNPAVIKSVLYRLGEIPSPAVRLPLLAAGPESTEAALQAREVVTASRSGNSLATADGSPPGPSPATGSRRSERCFPRRATTRLPPAAASRRRR
jgi:4-hydroxy-tetrahydrodipicolinate synthase